MYFKYILYISFQSHNEIVHLQLLPVTLKLNFNMNKFSHKREESKHVLNLLAKSCCILQQTNLNDFLFKRNMKKKLSRHIANTLIDFSDAGQYKLYAWLIGKESLQV